MVKVIHKFSDYVWIDGKCMKGEAKQTLNFKSWDDFQNWLGYTAEARPGETNSIDFTFIEEKENNA